MLLFIILDILPINFVYTCMYSLSNAIPIISHILYYKHLLSINLAPNLNTIHVYLTHLPHSMRTALNVPHSIGTGPICITLLSLHSNLTTVPHLKLLWRYFSESIHADPVIYLIYFPHSSWPLYDVSKAQ